MTEFFEMLQVYGFPIAACIAMAWYVKYITDSNNARMDKLNEDHKEELKQVSSALENNTRAIQHLSDLIAYTETGSNSNG